jgi:pimeloyl-ACP methyl ester carboxylesterase
MVARRAPDCLRDPQLHRPRRGLSCLDRPGAGRWARHVVTEIDLALDDGRTLHVYDTGSGDGTTGLAVFWHHGAPSTGAPPEPLFAAAAERGIRWVSHDRPGYGGSTPHPGRDVASAAADVASVADALGIDRFAVMGDSGGGPHALACAAILPGRVLATVCRGLPRSAPRAWTGSRA